jgi:hypothetical protein
LVLGMLAMVFWVWFCGLQLSWTGHRPLAPQPSTGNVFAINNHGYMYVTRQDLEWYYGLFVLAAIFMISCAFSSESDGRKKPRV